MKTKIATITVLATQCISFIFFCLIIVQNTLAGHNSLRVLLIYSFNLISYIAYITFFSSLLIEKRIKASTIFTLCLIIILLLKTLYELLTSCYIFTIPNLIHYISFITFLVCLLKRKGIRIAVIIATLANITAIALSLNSVFRGWYYWDKLASWELLNKVSCMLGIIIFFTTLLINQVKK